MTPLSPPTSLPTSPRPAPSTQPDSQLWPELRVLGHARNGREALELFERTPVQLVFLDVHMPGINGVEVGRVLAGQALVVFVTAYEQYAVQAFEQGAIDYLVKPIVPDRLHDTVQRLQRRLADAQVQAQDAERLDAVLARLAAQMRQQVNGAPWLQWIKASVGNAVRLIPVEEVAYLRSDEKYTLVVWSGGEALIRKPIRELIDELDQARFAQVHRSVIVNLTQVVQVVRGANETADVHLQGRSETLPVSRSYLHLFKQM